MEYREIVAVTGLSGLFQLMATKSDGAIVKNLADKSTKFISARLHNVTPLGSIEVYTTGDNVRLHYVFQQMQEHEATTPPTSVKASPGTSWTRRSGTRSSCRRSCNRQNKVADTLRCGDSLGFASAA